eukprot:TRINITY_DN110_c1_g2_i1.p1 TRINITY_DN110_c1_g2~~TRINITY_DN110_c1_g2_i1.p1  ORF type:complete len:678 (+),score=60.94 TRINITY_DN110_c1_g2_i1:734-2767(+)
MLFTNYFNSSLVWGVSIVYIHTHYIDNWIVSLFTYLVVYAEIMFMLFYFNLYKFLERGTMTAVVCIAYYTLAYAWFAGCSIFAVRAYELTERQKFFDKLWQEKETKELQRFLSNLPEPVIFTKQGKVIYFNVATLEMLELPKGLSEPECLTTRRMSFDNAEVTNEQVEESLGNILDKASKKPLKEYIKNVEDNSLTNFTRFNYLKNDTKRRLMIKCVKPKKESQSEEISEYIFHDITAVRTLERNKAKEHCFGILLATASHDIRTPLNGLLGAIEIISSLVNTTAGQTQLKNAKDCGRRMLHYLKGLELLYQINCKSLTLIKSLFNLPVVVKEVLEMNDFSINSKGLRLDFEVDDGMPHIVYTDRGIYSLILENLVENSVKHTYSGRIKVRLAFNSEESLLITEVSDTGIGMTPKQLKNAGTLFEKSKARCNINPQGLGLGLYLAINLCEHLEGSLSIKSTLGKGTIVSFKVKLYPYNDSPFNEIYTGPSADSTTIPAFPSFDSYTMPPKILIVDDDPLNIEVLSEYMFSVGIKADRAENGEIALNLAKKEGYGVIFMDINMPVMDGMEATKKIKELESKGKIPQCHIITVTAATRVDDPAVREMYLSNGFSEVRKFFSLQRMVVTKPTPRAKFLEVLKRYIQSTREAQLLYYQLSFFMVQQLFMLRYSTSLYALHI